MLNLNGVEYEIGERVRFAGVNFSIGPEVRYGLVGPNGAVKITLLRILNGELTSTRDSVTRHNKLKIGYLPQEGFVLTSNQYYGWKDI